MLDIAPTHLVDAVILITVLEAAALTAWHRLRGSGPAPRDWAPMLAAGLCLMLALRFALDTQGWGLWVLWLAAAGVAHAADMRARWRVRPS